MSGRGEPASVSVDRFKCIGILRRVHSPCRKESAPSKNEDKSVGFAVFDREPVGIFIVCIFRAQHDRDQAKGGSD